jgi:hypothetical protein
MLFLPVLLLLSKVIYDVQYVQGEGEGEGGGLTQRTQRQRVTLSQTSSKPSRLVADTLTSAYLGKPSSFMLSSQASVLGRAVQALSLPITLINAFWFVLSTVEHKAEQTDTNGLTSSAKQSTLLQRLIIFNVYQNLMYCQLLSCGTPKITVQSPA